MDLATATTVITALNDAKLDAHAGNLAALRTKVAAVLEEASHTTYAGIVGDAVTVDEFRTACARIASAVYRQYLAAEEEREAAPQRPALKAYRVGLTGAPGPVYVDAADVADAIRAARYVAPDATGTTYVERVTGKGTAVRR